MRTPLTDALTRQAYLKGLLGTAPDPAMAAGQQEAQPGVTTRRDQQRGGMMSRPYGGQAEGRGGGWGSALLGVGGALLGGVPGALAGSALGSAFEGSSSSGGQRVPSLGEQYPDIGSAFRRNLTGWLGGQSGLSPSVYQQALSEGMSAIGSQAQQSRQRLTENLAQRGMTQSGALSGGLADIEQGRLASTGSLVGRLQEADMQRRRQAMRDAMDIVARSRGQATTQEAARQRLMAQQPDTWDYLAEAVSAATPYTMGEAEPLSVQDMAAALLEGTQATTPTTTPTTQPTGWRYRYPWQVPGAV